MRCRMTASFRATATLALRRPFRLVSLAPQAFSPDHFGTRVSSTPAASNRYMRSMASPHFEIRPGPIDLPGGMASGGQSDIGTDTSRSFEARRIVNRRLEAECSDRADARHGHEPADLHIMTRQLVDLAIEIGDLLLYGLACLEQWPDRSHQFGTIFDQPFGANGEDIELGAADDETKVLEQAADLVLKIALDLDQ